MQKKKKLSEAPQLSEAKQILRDKQKAAVDEKLSFSKPSVLTPVPLRGSQENSKSQEKSKFRRRSPLLGQEGHFVPVKKAVAPAATSAFDTFMKYVNAPGGIELKLEHLCLLEPRNVEKMRAQLQEAYNDELQKVATEGHVDIDNPADMSAQELVKQVFYRSSVADMAFDKFLSCQAVFDLLSNLSDQELMDSMDMLSKEQSKSAPGRTVWEYVTNVLEDANAEEHAALLHRIKLLKERGLSDVSSERSSVRFAGLPEGERVSPALSEGCSSLGEIEVMPLRIQQFINQIEKDVAVWDQIKSRPDAAQTATKLMDSISTAFSRIKISPLSPIFE